MDSNFYALLKQRMAEHAEKDFARMVIPKSTRKKPLTNTQRHNRWLKNFQIKHGIPYYVYIKKVKSGEIPPLEKIENRYQCGNLNSQCDKEHINEDQGT